MPTEQDFAHARQWLIEGAQGLVDALPTAESIEEIDAMAAGFAKDVRDVVSRTEAVAADWRGQSGWLEECPECGSRDRWDEDTQECRRCPGDQEPPEVIGGGDC